MKKDIIKIITSLILAAILIPHNIYAFNGFTALMNDTGRTTGLWAYLPLPYFIFCIITPMLFIAYPGWKAYKAVKGMEIKKVNEKTA